MAETCLIWKVGLVALSGVQKHFCTILGSRDIGKMIWGIRFQEFEVMNNRISWNMIPPGFIHNFSSYEHFIRRGYILPLVCFRPDSNPFLYNMREPKYKQNNMRHQISRQKINQYLKCLIMIYNFDFLISRLPDIAPKFFCTPDGATDPTFQMLYVSAI